MHNPKLPEYLGAVPTPTLITWGKEDAIIPVNCAELYRQALPNARLEFINNCGHFPYLEKPEEFLKVALEFLSNV